MKEIIDRCEEKLLNAFKSSDIFVIEKLIHTNLIFNGPDGKLVTKEMDLAACKSGNAAFPVMDCIEREIQIFEDTAIVSTIIHMEGHFMGNPIKSQARFLRVWKEFDEGWKVIGGSSIILG